MTTENTTVATKPAVDHHVTLRELKWMLSELPGDATLYAVKDYYAPQNDFASAIGGSLYLETHSKYEDSFTTATVTSFLDYLNSLEDVAGSAYVWITTPFHGAVNGIRINSDGSCTLTAENPNAMP